MVYTAISDSAGTISQFTRKERIKLSHSGILTDYQKKLTIPWRYLMQTNFDDIRFVTDSGTHIPYWIESKTDSSTADVWVKTNFNDGDTYIWMYYGNSELSSGSSIDDTMIFGDDFEGYQITTPWTRYTGNPILSKSTVNPSWDYYFVNSPFIAVNEDGTPYQDASNRYYMYYSGSGNSDGHPHNNDRIGLARSTDLYNWTKVTSTIPPLDSSHDGLVLDFGATGQFDDSDAQIGTIIVKDGTFHMWYTGNDNSASDNLKFGYATSNDGISWTKSGDNPILSYGPADDNDGVYAPHVILDGDTWKMWYIGKRTVGNPVLGVMYATAPVDTPTVWTRHSNNFVYTHTATGNGMWGSYVWKDSSYNMIYSNYEALPYVFHHATSPDGISWTYQGIIFENGESGQWDEKFVVWISQIQVGDTWYSYYRATDNAGETRIGVATGIHRIPTPGDIPFGKWTTTGTPTVSNLWLQLGKGDGLWATNQNIVDNTITTFKTNFSDNDGRVRADYVETAWKFKEDLDAGEKGFGNGFWIEGRVYAERGDTSFAEHVYTAYTSGTHTSGYIYQDSGYLKFMYESASFEVIDDAYIPDVADNVHIHIYNSPSGTMTLMRVDYVYVRKYTAVEPTYSIGAEQHRRRTPQFIN